MESPSTTLRPLATEDELQRVRRWRRTQLERGGYPAELAGSLARRLYIDLHEALELVRRGCPPELALRILL